MISNSSESRRRTLRDALVRTGRQHALNGLFLLAALFALYAARSFVLPVTLAIVFALLLRPIVTTLKRWHIPAPLTAGVLILLIVGGGGYGVSSLYTPALEWTAGMPTALRRVESRLRDFRKPVEAVGRAAEGVEGLVNPKHADAPAVEVKQRGIGARVLTGTVDLLSSAVIVVFLLFFLLATGGRLLTKLAEFFAQESDSDEVGALINETERQTSHYLATITVINICLGTAVGVAMWAVGLPNPLLWGVVAGLATYVPYLGPAVGVTAVALASILSFDDLGRAAMAPLAYTALASLEGMLITPMVLGRRFQLDPCVVFIWLVFWGWMWGIAGAVLAMPMLTIVKIISERVESLRPISQLIGGAENSVAEKLKRRSSRARRRDGAAAESTPAPAREPASSAR